jgi:two-component system, response regulator PdtaR
MRALLITPCDAAELTTQLAAVGVHVVAHCGSQDLVQHAQNQSVDVVVAAQAQVDEGLLLACAALDAVQGPPVVLFVEDDNSAHMARALRSGVHAYEVRGCLPQRLLPVLQQACVRAQMQRLARSEHQALAARFDERKLVDRAKGILMRARQISEDEAFRILRSASMHGQQRVGEVSQQLISTAGVAHSINCAGQLRMLSQRRVKLAALLLHGVAVKDNAARALDSAQRCQALLADLMADLKTALPGAVFSQALQQVEESLQRLNSALLGRVDAQQLALADSAAEALLVAADALTSAIELSGLAPSLHVVNLCGRQRMLSQRLAKQALLAPLLGPAEQALMLATDHEFEAALRALQSLPLSTPDIKRLLEEASALWPRLRAAVPLAHTAPGRRQLMDASETVLDLFDQLTERYASSMQVLMG